jgi:hypothetical protein
LGYESNGRVLLRKCGSCLLFVSQPEQLVLLDAYPKLEETTENIDIVLEEGRAENFQKPKPIKTICRLTSCIFSTLSGWSSWSHLHNKVKKNFGWGVSS